MLDSEVQSQHQQVENKDSPVSGTNTVYKAFMFAIISNLSLILMQMNLKQLSKHFNPPVVLGIRGSLLFICNFLYLYNTNQPIHLVDKTNYRNTLKRALASSLTVITYLTSIKYIPLGIANALFNTSPILTFFIEAVYYKKSKIHVANLIITIVSFIGVLFIIQPSFLFSSAKSENDNENYIFYFVVLFAALSGSFSLIFLHDLRGKVEELVVLQHGYFIQNCMSLFVYLLTVTPQSTQSSIQYLKALTFYQAFLVLLNIIFLLISSFLMQYMIAKAMYLSTPAAIMPFSYIAVIIGVLIDSFIYDAKYNGLLVFGMLMASGGLFTKFIIAHIDNQKKEIVK